MMQSVMILASIVNFVLWYYVGQRSSGLDCPQATLSTTPTADTDCIELTSCSPIISNHPYLSVEPTSDYNGYRDGLLAFQEYPESSVIYNPYRGQHECTNIVQAHSNEKGDYLEHDCLGVVFAKTDASYNLIRYNSHWHLMRRLYSTTRLEPSGFFKVPGHANGRKRMVDKMAPFFEHLVDIEGYAWEKLRARGLVEGDPGGARTPRGKPKPRGRGEVVVMVVNEGEMDLLVNFACSCERHNISMRKMVVFTPNGHLVVRASYTQ